MWQSKQLTFLREEIEAVLTCLDNTGKLYRIISDGIERSGLKKADTFDQPWCLLPLAVCEGICGRCDQAMPVAAALHILRVAADVFDDIEDQDSPDSLSAIYGDPFAANAATTLIFLAQSAIGRSIDKGIPADAVAQLTGTINRYYIDACIGQHLDLEGFEEGILSEDKYVEIAGKKSATTAQCACHAGALLGNARGSLVEVLTVFGYNLGMGFQIADDIEGIVHGNDIQTRKITLPVIYAFAVAESDDKNVLKQVYLMHEDSPVTTSQIKDLLFRIGAVQYSMIRMESYRQRAKNILRDAEKEGFNPQRLNPLLQLE
jgi:geranylgeranyl pyrophosphate synthase